MLLRDLLRGCRIVHSRGDLSTDVHSIAYDSRNAVPGAVFVAVKGLRDDGNRFVPQALAAGASAVVSLLPAADDTRVPWVQVDDDRGALAVLAANLYGNPSGKLHAIGITGTNGKTTTAYLVEAVLNAAGFPAAVFGTVEYRGPGFVLAAERTTPEAPDLQHLFGRVVDAGWQYAVMEVSSIAIEMRRVDGLHFEVAVFTNLSQDHLDFHQDMESYFLAKKKMFTGLDGHAPRIMVLNADDPRFTALHAVAPSHVISYGMSAGADVALESSSIDGDHTLARFRTPAGTLDTQSTLLGRPNLYNMGAAIAVGLGLGLSLETIGRGIQQLPGVPGRFETIRRGQDFRVAVDYAHTDDALAKVLQSARKMTTGRVLVVFGCGGDRDRSKRALMGKAAAQFSDLAVVTSDNPRTEDPLSIIAEIETGLLAAGGTPGQSYRVVPDRRQAIHAALREARPKDTVVIAGKGHETYQAVGHASLPFDDRLVAQEFLDELVARRSR